MNGYIILLLLFLIKKIREDEMENNKGLKIRPI